MEWETRGTTVAVESAEAADSEAVLEGNTSLVEYVASGDITCDLGREKTNGEDTWIKIYQ